MPDNNQLAGGLDLSGNASFQSDGGVAGTVGRFFNDLNGTTAANLFTASEAEKTRNYNSAEAAKNRDWQEYMSNTAYQRAVADMKAAGINPAMAASQGGASTPGGSAASASSASSVTPKGVSDMIGRMASIAIGKGLEAKFTNSALKAADNHQLVAAKVRHLAAQEKSMSAKAAHDDAKLKWDQEKFDNQMGYNAIKDDRNYELNRRDVNSKIDERRTKSEYLRSHDYRWPHKHKER